MLALELGNTRDIIDGADLYECTNAPPLLKFENDDAMLFSCKIDHPIFFARAFGARNNYT